MKSLSLAIEYEESALHPMHAFVCESPFVKRELLIESNTETEPATLLFYVEGEREPYEEALKQVPTLEEYEITPADDDGFFVLGQETMAGTEQLFKQSLQRETLVVVPPIELRADRTALFRLVGQADQLQAAIDEFPDDVTVDVLRIQSYDAAVGDPLSRRQREAVQVAMECGYYEVPREGDLETVADELDCAVSTTSDLLRRAESTLVRESVGEGF